MRYQALFFLLLSTILNFRATAEIITSIVLTGNINVEGEIIKSQLNFKIGDDVNDKQLNYAIKQMYKTGLFANVSMNIEDDKLVINIEENPIISRLSIEGNKSVKTNDIKEKIKLKTNSIFTKEKLQSDILKMVKLYNDNGIVDVIIEPYKTPLEDNKINLIYKIEEGTKTKIRKINFINNEHFSDNLLKTVLFSKEYRFYNFLTNNHYYIQDRITLDGSVLRNFYFSRGFLNFKIESIIPEFDGNAVYLTFIVDEGKKYTVKSNNITTNIEGLNTDSIQNIIQTNEGDVFNINKVNRSISEITSFLHDNGYYFANITPDYKTEDNTVVINYKINEGKKVYVNRINIEGNDHTLDHVIRRELKISEGDPYNLTLVNRSKQNLLRLGFFNDVEITTSKENPNQVNLTVTVKERSTGSANIGGGISSESGLVGNINVHENNLLGTGNFLSFSLEKGSSTFSSSINFTKPYIFNYPISSGFDLFQEKTNHKYDNPYDSSSYGFTLRASYKISDNLKHSLKYSYKKNTLSGIDKSASSSIKSQAGVTHTSLIGHTLIYDKLSNPIKPTSGYLLKGEQELAGIGGNLYYVRSDFSAAKFMTVKNYEDIVLQMSLKSGYVSGYNNQEVRIGQRFFMDNYELRGFKLSGIGPRDIATDNSLGGKFRATTTLQADFPIGLPSDLEVKGSVFLDTGTITGLDSKTTNTVDSGNLRASIGFGISWFSPVGLLRLDFGFPIIKDKFDKTDMIRFNMGKSF
ncbi:MAG: outer membrane protein assembly factor BamA [Rickettsiaceae bacterium H1]|nr:outer membrane protein assembly factor BamA [Rickettsiaceae bacterium H1]